MDVRQEHAKTTSGSLTCTACHDTGGPVDRLLRRLEQEVYGLPSDLPRAVRCGARQLWSGLPRLSRRPRGRARLPPVMWGSPQWWPYEPHRDGGVPCRAWRIPHGAAHRRILVSHVSSGRVGGGSRRRGRAPGRWAREQEDRDEGPGPPRGALGSGTSILGACSLRGQPRWKSVNPMTHTTIQRAPRAMPATTSLRVVHAQVDAAEADHPCDDQGGDDRPGSAGAACALRHQESQRQVEGGGGSRVAARGTRRSRGDRPAGPPPPAGVERPSA